MTLLNVSPTVSGGPDQPRSPARRAFVAGAAMTPLAAMLADPIKARAAAAETEIVSVPTASGENVACALARPTEVAPGSAPGVILIHEWWGLNDQIRAMATEFAREGYVALAADLYGGKVAASPEDARTLMGAVDETRARDVLASCKTWLADAGRTSGKTGTCGWCFGGGWSLDAAINTPIDAAVVYYGRVNRSAEELANLQGPVLGHFATKDAFINAEMVAGFEAAMKEAGKSLEVYWYEADHAFANPTGGRYDEEDAALAWSRTTEFLNRTLRG